MKILTNKQLSQKSEKAAADRFEGKVQMASGALRIAKGDVLTDRYLIEDKITLKNSYSLKRGILDKMRLEATNRGRRGMLRVTLSGDTQKGVYCVVTESEMLEILMLAKLL